MKKIISKINKKTIAIIVSIALAAIALFTSTYSLFYGESVASNPGKYSTGVLAITAKSKSDNVNLDNAIPMSDEDGVNTEPYIFTIKNVGNVDYKFDIKLLSTGSSNIINSNYIKLKVDDGSVTTLSSLTNSIIKSNVVLKAQESLDVSLRVWLASNTPNSEIGKTFNSKIVANGQAIYTESNYDSSNFATYISSLFDKTGTVTSDSIVHDIDSNHQLIKDPAGNIRYYGTGITSAGGTYKEPDNYVDIGDNVLWRIIGVFDGKLKLIRSAYITSDNNVSGFSWDTSASTVNSGYGINEWSQADIMKLLNPEYENNQDLNSSGTSVSVNNSLWYNSQSGTCYTGQSNTTTSCNFTSTGLSDSVKDKIAEVTWNIGGWNTSLVYPNLIYEKERGTTVISSPSDGITRTTTWTGKIGLAYPSDYGYATDLQECSQNLNHYSSSTNNYACRGNNWMWRAMTGATTASSNGSKSSWLLTPNSSHAYFAWYVISSGYVDNVGVYFVGAVSPVLYLNSELVIESGIGTSSDPYVLSA